MKAYRAKQRQLKKKCREEPETSKYADRCYKSKKGEKGIINISN